MLKLFDYLFYRASEFYLKKEGENGFTFRGVLVTSTMQGFNLSSILFLIEIATQTKIDVNKYYAGVFALVLIIINLIKYSRNNYEFHALKKRWNNEDDKTKRKKQRLLIVYIVFSTFLFLGTAIYLGEQKW